MAVAWATWTSKRDVHRENGKGRGTSPALFLRRGSEKSRIERCQLRLEHVDGRERAVGGTAGQGAAEIVADPGKVGARDPEEMIAEFLIHAGEIGIAGESAREGGHGLAAMAGGAEAIGEKGVDDVAVRHVV